MEEPSQNSSAHLGGYLHGTKPFPTNPALSKSLAWIATSPAEIAEVEKYEKDSAKWIEKDALA